MDIQTATIVITAIGVLIAAINQIYTSREANRQRQTEIETRQIETFMQTVGRVHPSDFAEVVYRQEWTDYPDWLDKYGPWTNPQAYASLMRLLQHNENLGLLVKRNIVDMRLVYLQNRGASIRVWEKVEPLIHAWREKYESPEMFELFEFLVNEIKGYKQQQATIDV